MVQWNYEGQFKLTAAGFVVGYIGANAFLPSVLAGSDTYAGSISAAGLSLVIGFMLSLMAWTLGFVDANTDSERPEAPEKSLVERMDENGE